VPSDLLPLGAWENDRVLLKNVPVGDRGNAAEFPAVVQFQLNVAKLIVRREQNANAERDQPAAFVLVSPEQYRTERLGRTEERLIYTGSKRVTGRIHFVTADAISSLAEDFSGDDKPLFARLGSLPYASSPTLLYVPQAPTSTLSFYPKGTATDEGVIEISLVKQNITAEAIEDAIHALYLQEFVTPDQCYPLKLWLDPGHGKPMETAEKGVQQLLRAGLSTRFFPCSIRQEQPGKPGRTDLEIVDDRTTPEGQSIHHAVLELKVLRSRGSTGNQVTNADTDKHIQEGLEQAYTYGLDKNTLQKLLCCFDMRDTDIGNESTFAHVKAHATTLKVLLRRWFLYRDSAAYRAAVAAAAIRT